MSIKIHIYFFLMLAYMFAIGKFKIFIYYYAFVLLHELSHVLMGLFLKKDAKEIILLPIGVNAKFTNLLLNREELLISLAGPLASFLFAILLNNETLKTINIIIACFNLIPIYPLDGGRIIRSVLNMKLSLYKTEKIMNYISKIFLVLLILVCIALAIYFNNYYYVILPIYIFYIYKSTNKY